MIDPTISPTLHAAVEREIRRGETVRFVETPQPRFFTSASTPAFLFAIPWTAFALFWMAGAAGFKVPNFNKGFDLFPLFGVPFVLIGMAMLSTPYWAYRNAFRSVYVITDQRAITFVGGFRTTIRSFAPEHLQAIYRTERSDGSGDVIIGSNWKRDSDGDAHATHYGFLGVVDAKATEDRLRSLAEAGRDGHP